MAFPRRLAALLLLAPVCVKARSVIVEYPPSPFLADAPVESVTCALEEEIGGQRHYFLTTTQPQRDDMPRERRVREQPGQPRVRSGSLFFDALFALALEDMRLDSVSEIRDDAYNGGAPIRREVFQTGEKWHYVWTRDVAYAVDLGLAVFDPLRSVRTILFKTSGFREGLVPPDEVPEGSRQIVQDTGSGGSWPVSTDRVSWAFAAEALLDQLVGRDREAFADRAYHALRGTIAADRVVAFDPATGLYGGEQSFLDWRTQTYAPWITDNLAWMSESKALSTNACHHRALLVAARLAAERGEHAEAARYGQWAEALAQAINDFFWIPEAGLYASLTTPGRHARPEFRFDLLGSALVILSEIAPAARAQSVLSRYPHGPMGAPVYFPQQPDTYVYHNRAIWPFVTAYALAAAHRTRHVAAAEAAVATLLRGAALNLSNMENLEWLTGRPYFDEGPAINSRRQLWSVAGYLGMVLHSFFGYKATPEGLNFDPFLTAGMRERLGPGEFATLEGLDYQGASLDVRLALPAPVAEVSGFYPLDRISLNGRPVTGPIPREALRDLERNLVILHFGPFVEQAEALTAIPPVDPLSRSAPAVFAPACPELQVVEVGGHFWLEVHDAANPSENTHYELFRDGESIGWMSAAGRWPEPLERGFWSHHYTAVAEFLTSGHRSHTSRPLRLEGDGFRFVPLEEDPALIEISRPGTYALRLRYHNDAHTIDSGVTCGVKRVRLRSGGGRTAGEGVLQMPQVEDRGDGRRWVESTALIVTLEPGRYRFEISDFFNMSYLAANATYAHAGGRDGPRNDVDLAGLCVIPLPAGSP